MESVITTVLSKSTTKKLSAKFKSKYDLQVFQYARIKCNTFGNELKFSLVK